MSIVPRDRDSALKRELLQFVAPCMITADMVHRHTAASHPKVSIVGVHFDEQATMTAAAAQSGNRARNTLSIVHATPFSDGITIKRSWFQSMPNRFALSMQWPLDVPDFNKARKEDGKSGSASLVYYRTLADLGKDCTSDWHALFNLPSNAHPGEAILRVTCEQPCWRTTSKRYEAPIQVALGMDGPLLWEAWPTAPTNKKQDHSNWLLRCADSKFVCRLRTEDVLGLVFSVGDQSENVFALSAKLETVITTEARGGQPEVLYTDAATDPSIAYFDVTHLKFADGKKALRNASCVAFLVAFLEASQAIRDEEGGGSCKGRRNANGRLQTIPSNGIKKIWNK